MRPWSRTKSSSNWKHWPTASSGSSQLVAATAGKQGNALRTELASALPDNHVIAATPPFAVGNGAWIGGMKAADVAAVLRGLASQVPRRAPSIA